MGVDVTSTTVPQSNRFFLTGVKIYSAESRMYIGLNHATPVSFTMLVTFANRAAVAGALHLLLQQRSQS